MPQGKRGVRRSIVVVVAFTLGRRYGRGFGDFKFTCGSAKRGVGGSAV